MLVLSQKKDGRIFVGDEIEVVVVEIRGDKVRLGFKAPRNTPIVRENAKRKESRDATEGESEEAA